jgi:hypothetical protein
MNIYFPVTKQKESATFGKSIINIIDIKVNLHQVFAGSFASFR